MSSFRFNDLKRNFSHFDWTLKAQLDDRWAVFDVQGNKVIFDDLTDVENFYQKVISFAQPVPAFILNSDGGKKVESTSISQVSKIIPSLRVFARNSPVTELHADNVVEVHADRIVDEPAKIIAKEPEVESVQIQSIPIIKAKQKAKTTTPRKPAEKKQAVSRKAKPVVEKKVNTQKDADKDNQLHVLTSGAFKAIEESVLASGRNFLHSELKDFLHARGCSSADMPQALQQMNFHFDEACDKQKIFRVSFMNDKDILDLMFFDSRYRVLFTH